MAHRTIPAIVVPEEDFDVDKRHWKLALFHPNGTPFLSENGELNTGPSAYDVAVANGFEGTEEEWLDSLVGSQGPPGADGEDGTQGPPGEDGADGAPGADGEGLEVGAWTNVPLEANWATAAGWDNLQYRTVGTKWIELRGVVANTNGSSGTIGTIPLAGRPATKKGIDVAFGTSAAAFATTAGATRRIIVNTNGTLVQGTAGTGAYGFDGWMIPID